MTTASATPADTRRQFIQFVVVGILSTACNLASRYAFQTFVGYEWALVGANAVGVITAYLMNRWFVFRSNSGRYVRELSRFLGVNLVGIAVSWAVAVAMFRWFLPAIAFQWHPDLVAHAIGILVPVVPNYLAHKFWTFGRTSSHEPIRRKDNSGRCR